MYPVRVRQEGRNMPQIALHTVLHEGREAVHDTIPPDIADALAQYGVRDWRIWRDGRHLFHLWPIG
jgi:L-rhamnose mutarotase